MSCKIPAEVLRYIELVEADTPRACPEQHALAALIRKAFAEEDLRVDEEQLRRYMSLVRYFPYDELFPWEAFLTALWLCTYRADGQPRWKTLLCMVGRGAGKDGFIAYVSFCGVSPYNPVAHYNVDICANNEEQATTPVKDLAEVLDSPKWEKKLNRHYYHTKELVQGRKYKGVVKGRTNNPKGRDGMRSGMVVFNEVHAYENYNNIKVFVTGLGKVAQPRVGIFTSNGDVSDGPLDDYLSRGRRILFEGEEDKGFLPFICCLSSEEQIHDPENWYMANPSLAYSPTLLRETEDEYRDWCDHPEQNGDFPTKRMNLRKNAADIAVTDYAKIRATNVELPDLTGRSCVAGLDYAEISDWASVDLHFRDGDIRLDISHSWICKQSKTLHRIRAPWQDWAAKGLVTVVDDVSISPDLLAEYLRAMGLKYNIVKLCMDHFRWTLVADAMRRIGFDAADKSRVKLIRPSDIMQVDPVIQECFDRGYFVWGDTPPLRWAVNNTKRVRRGQQGGTNTGNYFYAKIEAKSRKTDPFMALVAAMCEEPALAGTGKLALPPIPAIRL